MFHLIFSVDQKIDTDERYVQSKMDSTSRSVAPIRTVQEKILYFPIPSNLCHVKVV